MDSWEYNTIDSGFGEPIPISEMDSMGAEGWECFSVYAHGSTSVAYFKRRLPALTPTDTRGREDATS